MLDETADRWGTVILRACRPRLGAANAAHDEGHLRRVLTMARRIAVKEGPHDPSC